MRKYLSVLIVYTHNTRAIDRFLYIYIINCIFGDITEFIQMCVDRQIDRECIPIVKHQIYSEHDILLSFVRSIANMHSGDLCIWIGVYLKGCVVCLWLCGLENIEIFQIDNRMLIVCQLFVARCAHVPGENVMFK